jgi:hypothetical protein
MAHDKPKIDAPATAIADMFNNTKNIQHTDALNVNADTTKSKPVQIDI